ncbi:MAG: hypothetical protein ACI9XR_000923 [Flavobacterium sp.]|jgi:hypothetical protein
METTFRCNRNIRYQFFQIIENYSANQLNTIPTGFSNNIIWNIGHALATQQILIYELSGLKGVLLDDFINLYRNGTKPTGQTSEEEINQIQKMLLETVDVLEKDFKSKVFKKYQLYTTKATGFLLENAKQATEFNNIHEGIHLGIVLQIRKFV